MAKSAGKQTPFKRRKVKPSDRDKGEQKTLTRGADRQSANTIGKWLAKEVF